MKSFLDRFRRKVPEEKSVAPRKNTAASIARGPGASGPPSRQEPEEAKPAGAKAAKAPLAATSQAVPAKVEPEWVEFQFGDFAGRIPQELLAEMQPDPKATIRFEIADLSARIARGQTTITLAELYQRAPDMFQGKIADADQIEIRFPWQRLLEKVRANLPGTTVTAC